MGKSFNTGLLTNGIAQDSSNNIGIGGAANASYKLAVTGAGSLTGNLAVGGTTNDTSGGLYSNIAIDATSYSRYSLLTSGTARGRFQFDGTNTSMLATSTGGKLQLQTLGANAMEFYTNDALRATITSSGNVGIGTSSPSNPLHIQSNTVSQLNVTALSGNTNAQINLEPTGTGIALIGPANNVDFAFRTNATERMRITSGGQVQIKQSANTYSDGLSLTNSASATWKIVVGGDNNLYLGYGVSADRGQFSSSTGVYTPLSDINKKKDFEDSTIGLDAILGLKPTLYRMTDEDNTEKHLGFIAQEVKDFIPQAYVESGVENKFIGLNYNAIVAALVKAIQEQQAMITSLQDRLDKAGL